MRSFWTDRRAKVALALANKKQNKKRVNEGACIRAYVHIHLSNNILIVCELTAEPRSLWRWRASGWPRSPTGRRRSCRPRGCLPLVLPLWTRAAPAAFSEVWHDMTMIWYEMAWYGIIRHGCDMVWLLLWLWLRVWHGRDIVWPYSVLHCISRYDTIVCIEIVIMIWVWLVWWCGMIWYDNICYYMVWHVFFADTGTTTASPSPGRENDSNKKKNKITQT